MLSVFGIPTWATGIVTVILAGLVVLSPVVIKITRNYVERKLKGSDVEPLLSNFEDIQKEAADAVRSGAQ